MRADRPANRMVSSEPPGHVRKESAVQADSIATDPVEASRLRELDDTHWLHPQGDLGAAPGMAPKLMFGRGQGSTLFDVGGRPYLDAMAGLWNVNVGYGRA